MTFPKQTATKAGEALVLVKDADGAIVAFAPVTGSLLSPINEQHESQIRAAFIRTHGDICEGNQLEIMWVERGTTIGGKTP